MKFFLASTALLVGMLFAFMHPGKLMAGDFVQIAWDPGRELLSTGSVYSNYPYPLWTVVVMLPFIVWPLQTAMALWLFANILMLAASLALILLETRLEITPFLFGAAVLASALFLPVLSSIWVGQLSIFSLLIFALTTWLFRRQHWTWLGIVLGLSFIKPQVMIMLSSLLLLHALLHRRWQMLLGFGGVIALLTLISLPFISSPGQIIGGGISSHIAEYVPYTSTIWGLFTISGISWLVPAVVSAALILWLGVIWWPFLRQEMVPDDRVLFLFSAAVLVNLITIPYSWMHNLVLMLLPLGWCLVLTLNFKGKERYAWLALLFIVMHPLMLGLFAALNGPTNSQAHEIIPALILLPGMCLLESRKNRTLLPIEGNAS